MSRQAAHDLLLAAMHTAFEHPDHAERVRQIKGMYDSLPTYIAIALDRAYYESWQAIGRPRTAEELGVSEKRVYLRAKRHADRYGLRLPAFQHKPPIEHFDARIWLNGDRFAPRGRGR